jgi:hypothetical protein
MEVRVTFTPWPRHPPGISLKHRLIAGLMGRRVVLDVGKKRYVPLPGIDHWFVSGLTPSLVNTELPRELEVLIIQRLCLFHCASWEFTGEAEKWSEQDTSAFHIYCVLLEISKVRRGSSVEPTASYCCPVKMTHILRYSWGWNCNKCIGF